MDETVAATRAHLDGEPFEREVMQHSLTFNLFPHVDVFLDSGYTKEEEKMLGETRKILDLPSLLVEATCVRVPVLRCHSEAVTVELERALTPAAARQVMATFDGLSVNDDPATASFPQPIDVTGQDDVFVGRVRESRVFEPGLTFWLVGDQLLKGPR